MKMKSKSYPQGINCENPDGKNYSPYSANQVYGRGLDSRCFVGNLTTSSSGTGTKATYCLTATCMGPSTINVKWGGQTIMCTAKGPMTVSGYRGVINCPDPVKFCSTVGVPVCPRNCMGRGTCMSGKCVCNSGFKGTDCGFTTAGRSLNYDLLRFQ